MGKASFACLLLLGLILPAASAQAASNATAACSWDFPTQMGSGGGILMFFLGFMAGALVIGLIWLLMDQRWRLWHLWGGGGSSAPVPQYAPLNPQGYPGGQDMYQQPQGYPPAAYAQQQGLIWPHALGMSNYRSQYEVISPGY